MLESCSSVSFGCLGNSEPHCEVKSSLEPDFLDMHLAPMGAVFPKRGSVVTVGSIYYRQVLGANFSSADGGTEDN